MKRIVIQVRMEAEDICEEMLSDLNRAVVIVCEEWGYEAGSRAQEEPDE